MSESTLPALASYLAARHEAILQAWEKEVESDCQVAIASAVSIVHFRDLIPEILRSFERRLLASLGSAAADRQEREERQDMSEHGLHRWQQGFSLRELVREWGHIQVCVLDEIERFGCARPVAEAELIAAARRVWVQICGEGTSESVAEYDRLQKAEAAGRLRDLQEALEHLNRLELLRAESLHEAVHDLRGNVGLVAATTAILNEDGVPEGLRNKAFNVLRNSTSALQQMLEDLMSLARLEAGRERRNVAPFDAAVQLRELCTTLEPLARERGLFLKPEGPPSLPVEGDLVKVLRIVQNLALNALKYTSCGGVTVSWCESQETSVERWLIRVEDTGPGFESAPGSPIGQSLEEATRVGRKVEDRTAYDEDLVREAEPIPRPAPAAGRPPAFQRPGEGIGLSIVKRLCELLEAALQVASREGEGTVFQVSLPRRYGDPSSGRPSVP